MRRVTKILNKNRIIGHVTCLVILWLKWKYMEKKNPRGSVALGRDGLQY